MKTNNEKRGFINVQLFADPTGDTTPTDTQPSIDYEVEYKKMLAERDSYKAEAEKQKGLKDKYASENADYKKKELDKMSDDEKKQQEYQELVNSANQMKAELEQMKLEKELLSNGFTTEESEKLIKEAFSPKAIAEIITQKVELAVKSAKAEMIKVTTPAPPTGNGTTKGSVESDFQKHQKAKQKTNNIVEL